MECQGQDAGFRRARRAPAQRSTTLRALEIAPQTVRVFTVNGEFERHRSRVLAPNDELSAIPPVGGG
jgi:hypothetical protein